MFSNVDTLDAVKKKFCKLMAERNSHYSVEVFGCLDVVAHVAGHMPVPEPTWMIKVYSLDSTFLATVWVKLSDFTDVDAPPKLMSVTDLVGEAARTLKSYVRSRLAPDTCG